MAETRALKRIVKNLESVKDKANRLGRNAKISEIRMCLAMASDEWKDFQSIETRIGGEFGDLSEIANKIESLYFNVKATLYESEKEFENGHARENAGNMAELMANQSQFISEVSLLNKRDSEVKLPRVNIPTFSGNYSEFPSFKDLFEASVDKNENISPVHKLQYLKSVLKGDAYGLIRHLAITAVNYAQAWEKIKERYDKPRQVIQTLLKQFMEQPVMQCSSAKALRQLADTSDEIVRGLHVLGEKAEERDPWLLYILVNKLDGESREAWAEESVEEDYPSLKNFLQFLSRRSDVLESITPSKRSKQALPKQTGVMVSQTITTSPCVLCSGDHYISKCSRYLELTVDKRKEWASEKKLCFNCLSSKHQAVACRSRFLCRICRRKHHVTLHPEPTKEANNENNPSSSEIPESNVHVAVNYETGWQSFQAILPTAIVLIKNRSGQPQRCRVLLDSGSQSSFITEDCAQMLQLKRERANIKIFSITAGNLLSRSKCKVVLESLHDTTIKVTLEALIIKHLPTCLPKTKVYLDQETMLNELELADPRFNIPGRIDLLIGADKFFEILQGVQKQRNSLTLTKTLFGWIVTGQPQNTNAGTTEAYTIETESASTVDQTLRRFWELEEMPTRDKLSEEERECESLFVETHQRRDDGRYVVKLPFKKNRERLGDSLHVATNRFRAIERRFLSNPVLRDAYVQQMREYINLGHMRELPKTYHNAEGYYLPHHSVAKETSDTTKLRVVFDGSAKSSNGVSLNEILLVGPTLQPTLWQILLRFRTYKVALVADIEKMYRQVIVSEEHQHFQTVLWREKPEEALKHYQLTRVTFGLGCSAFLAIRTLQQTAENTDDNCIKQRILNDFYVDDLLSGSNDEREAIHVKEQLTSTLMKGGFHLTKWRSNRAKLAEETNEIALSELGDDKSFAVKTLGLQWYPKKDIFTFKVFAERDGDVNKRKILSEFSRLFDPLGFLSPTTILLKILFQKLWLSKIDWDEKLPIEIEEEYKRIRSQFTHLEKVNIPRLAEYNGSVQIHGFSDASEAAYCAVVYIRMIKDDGEITSQLLTSKTKVAPLKQISIPRLELCAALLLARLLMAIKETLSSDVEYFAWTDSTIVLSWLSTHPANWKTFIANRTSEILDIMDRKHWAHVKSKDNPADHGSRGRFWKIEVNCQKYSEL